VPAGNKPRRSAKKMPQGLRDQVAALLTEFVGWAHRERRQSWTRMTLASQMLLDFVVDRYNGELDGNRSMFNRVINEGARARQPIEHLLCPDRRRTDAFCARRMSGFNEPDPYSVAAFFTLLPDWLDFLQHRGSLQPDHARTALDSLI